MPAFTMSQAREHLADLLNRVLYKGERIVLERRGKQVAALIPIEDLQLLEKLEDKMDVEAAREALAESDERIPYDQVRKELGLED